MSDFIEYNNLYAFHPGYYISEIIDDMNVTRNEFASRLAISINDLDLLLEGKIDIDNDIARKLSVMTGSSIDLWINLQNFISKFWTSDEEDYNQPAFDTLEEERRYFLGRITKEEREAILA